MATEKLYKALQSVALGYSKGNVSVDVLIKACDVYKSKTGFEDDFDYQIKVAKSCYDHINNVAPDAEISKAILPGQTKVIDGVMYVYSATAPGSQVPYDWHVVKKVGRGKNLDDKKVDAKQKYVNNLFPKDLSSLKVIGSAGGSTGAKIVEDVNGNRYIMKRGDGGQYTNNGHIKNEYLANQLYDILGLRVPDYELYDDNGTAVILSKFIPGTKAPTMKDYNKLAQGFIADCVLANWDVYENDNCLIDFAGRVIRVDNGGTLNFRAHGGQKPFNDDILKTFQSMIQYNQSIYATLDKSDVLKQIQDIQAKKNDIVSYLKESGQDALADTIGKRIDNLKDVVAQLAQQVAIKDIPIQPRTLKTDAEMYRTFTPDEIKEMWDKAQGSDGRAKLFYKGSNGWDLLSTICKARGFDARPEVVTESEYWKQIAAHPDRQFFRGLDSNWHSTNAAVKSLLFEDDCFYGTMGVYGEGIYAHRNDTNGVSNNSNATNYKKTDSWGHAKSYAHTGGAVVKGLISDDAKIIKYEDIRKDINSFVYSEDTKEAKKLQKEIASLDSEIIGIQDKIDNAGKNIEAQIHAQMHYDDASIKSMEAEIDSIDWGAVNAFGDRDIPSFSEFVEGKISDWVKAQGGTSEVKKGMVTFTLPNSSEPLSINTYQYDGPFSIKQKNPFTPAFNGAVKRFQDWMMREHVQKVTDAVKTALDKSGDIISKLNEEKRNKIQDRDAKKKTLDALSKVDSDKSIWGAIVSNRRSDETLGIWAALKGYDAIECKNGNGSSNSFYVILNRSKLIISNEVDYI